MNKAEPEKKGRWRRSGFSFVFIYDCLTLLLIGNKLIFPKVNLFAL